MTYKDILELRLYNNGLIDKYDDLGLLVSNLLGIQSQYQNYALISIINRINNIEIDNIFSNSSLIKSWGQRNTLHIYNKDTYKMISKIYKDKPSWIDKYTKDLNVDLNDVFKRLELELKNKNLTKEEIEKIVEPLCGNKIMTWSGLLILATYSSVLYGVLNKEDSKIYKLNDIKIEKDDSEFIRNYFKYYGPATIKDFIHFSGLRYKDINKYLNVLLEFDSFNFNGDIYYYKKNNNMNIKYPIVLGKFDNLLVSYEDKRWILGKYNSKTIWKDAGQIEGAIITEKGLVGTWHYKVVGNKVIYIVDQLTNIGVTDKKRIEGKFNNYNKIFNKKMDVDWRMNYE